MSESDQQLQRRLGYQFADASLLILALSHRSCGEANNERLEFLGDSVLGLTISTFLYEKFPDTREGQLSRMRSQVVRAESLAEVARELDLGPHLKLGQGELKSGGFRRASILGDTVEALIGAIYLDAGLSVAQDCIRRWFAAQLQRLNLDKPGKDGKTALQEWLQQRGLNLPDYQLVKEEGEPHCRRFTVSVSVAASDRVFTATDSSRRKAEQQVARQMLTELEKTP